MVETLKFSLSNHMSDSLILKALYFLEGNDLLTKKYTQIGLIIEDKYSSL